MLYRSIRPILYATLLFVTGLSSISLSACDDEDFSSVKSNQIALTPGQVTLRPSQLQTRESDAIFEIRNSGEAPLSISDIYLEAANEAGERVRLGDCDSIAQMIPPATVYTQDVLPTCPIFLRERPSEYPRVIQPNQFDQIRVTLRPIDGVDAPADIKLVVESNGSNERTSTSDIFVTASSPDISGLSAVVFPPTGGRTNYLLRNLGGAPLVIERVTLEATDPEQFPLPASGQLEFDYDADRELNGAVIEPNQSLQLKFIYTPEDEGADQANFTIRSNDPEQGDFIILLTSEDRPSTLNVTPNPVVFVHEANETNIQMVRFSNTGLEGINTFLAIEPEGGPYRLSGQSNDSFQVPVQGEQEILIEYRAERDPAQATLVVTADADNFEGGELRVPLTASQAGSLKLLEVDQSALSFDGVSAGESTSVTMTVSSTGDSPVTLSGYEFTGSEIDVAVFSVDDNAMGTLSPGESREINVTFTRPTGEEPASTYQADLLINSDSDGGAIQVSLIALP